VAIEGGIRTIISLSDVVPSPKEALVPNCRDIIIWNAEKLLHRLFTERFMVLYTFATPGASKSMYRRTPISGKKKSTDNLPA
jgi:hypothetical protein